MPQWVTFLHVLLTSDTYSQREEFWVTISVGLAFCALLAAMIAFAENAAKEASAHTRCANARHGMRLLLLTFPILALGNYAGMLAALAVLIALLVLFFVTLKGVVRSIGSCRTEN